MKTDLTNVKLKVVRRHQKSKTGVSVASQKGHVSSKNFKKKKKKS